MENEVRPVWLITGAAGVLGRELVRQALDLGADCIALDRNVRGLNALHDELQQAGKPVPALMPFDLAGAGPDDYLDLAEGVRSAVGRLDVLVHNAADFVALRPLEHQPVDEWMKILQSGLTGPLLLSQALLPLLREADKATMVYVSDEYCLKKPANWGAYGVSQAGRDWMASALASELGPRGPRVLQFDPGPFYSPLRAAAWPAIDPADLPDAARAASDLIACIREEQHP
ncbi:MAG: SDR family NAD(P)-dependent oxidoreductase [Wenzhouxiangella sp.]|nr:MAG: SDR family NAD(P)-dependent oxidoreductase [Wenzhouxiangella sp.]